MSQKQYQTPTSQAVLAAWVKKMNAIEKQAQENWENISLRTMGLVNTANGQTAMEREAIGQNAVEQMSSIEYSQPQEKIDASENAVQSATKQAITAAEKRGKLAQTKIFKEEDAEKAALKKQELADKKAATTVEITTIIDQQLAALLPSLQVGYGNSIGGKDKLISLQELKKALSSEGNIGLFTVDENTDGLFSLEEVQNRLPKVPQSNTAGIKVTKTR